MELYCGTGRMIECRGPTAVVPSVLLPLYSIIGTFALKGVSRENGCWPCAPVLPLDAGGGSQTRECAVPVLDLFGLLIRIRIENKDKTFVQTDSLWIYKLGGEGFFGVCKSPRIKKLLRGDSLWLRINLVFHHVSPPAFIMVWVFLMSYRLEINQSWSITVERQSVMACHSVQTDKLLCCQSSHQIKQTVIVINGKQ